MIIRHDIVRPRYSRFVAALAGLLLAFLVFVSGCTDPYTMYQISAAPVETGQKIMVMPFMDTRTFHARNDPHADDVGLYVRDIFTDVARARAEGTGAEILSPDMATPTRSMSTAEVAEMGRQYGADVVIAGQVFSFNTVRAASIPPRAGMFVRVISAKTGALLFVGDYYHASPIPVGAGDRDDQARYVAEKLVEGFLARVEKNLAAGVASGSALANLIGARLDSPAWDDAFIPEAPPVVEGAALPDEPEPLPPPAELTEAEDAADAETEDTETADAERGEPQDNAGTETAHSENEAATPDSAPEIRAAEQTAGAEAAGEEVAGELVAEDAAEAEEPIVLVQTPIVPMRPDEVDELPELSALTLAATLASIDARAAISERLAAIPGDQLAEDLWEADGNVFGDEPDAPAAPAAPVAPVVVLSAAGGAAGGNAFPGPVSPERIRRREGETPATPREAEVASAARAHEIDNSPVVSEPMAFEQPRTYRLVDLPEDPALATEDADALVERASPGGRAAAAGSRVLILPYHDRENPNNLIPNTGGGEVVTTLYGTRLALDPGLTLLWDGTGMATHDRLPTREEALELGRLAGADFVIRGQVVEFRRAQSVPSFYSAVISTAVLAAQMFFAETSGVDVATEVYRVADGACVMSRRDRARQKYVVQAEKTVRRLAEGVAESVSRAIREAAPEEMDPLIDELDRVAVL